MKKLLLLLFFFLAFNAVAQPPSTLETYVICDDNNDGFGVFDLSSWIPSILFGLNPNTTTVSFHLSNSEAIAGVNPINPINSFVSQNQTVYIRVVDTAAGQVYYSTQNLVVTSNNAGADGSLTVCDTSTAPINLFDLIISEQQGGAWTRTSGTGGTFDAASGTYTPSAGATSSTFTYTVAAITPISCPSDTSVATIFVQTCTTQPTCGSAFTDAGGATASYTNSADSTVTICPTTAGERVTVTFTSFNTEATYDALYVFDGNTLASPQIASGNLAANVPGGLAGGYWGTTIPGPFASTSLDGCLTFRFRSDGSVIFAGWVANVTCSPQPTCPRVSNLVVTSPTATSINLGWINNSTATQWEILALPCGSPAPTATTTGQIVTTNPYTYTGLSSGTCYNFYVRAICSSSDSSIWSNVVSATTLASCPQPNTLSASTISVTTATFGWTNTSTATQWEIVVLPSGAAAPTSSTAGVVASTNPYIATGLSPDTCYSYYVRAICSATDASNWAGGFNFCTLPSPVACGGQFIDNGGSNGNYLNNTDRTTTICPTNVGDSVTVVFNSFSTEVNWDALYVFDGSSTTAPQIASVNPVANVPGGLAGGFWGTTIPGPFTSSSADGCLTFRFRSDGSVTNPGWVANISCNPAPDRIALIAFVDANSNGVKDSDELVFPNGNFMYQQNNDGIDVSGYSPTGQYFVSDSNPANTYNFSYQINANYAPHYTSGTTTFTNISIPTGSGTQFLYFPIISTQRYNDVTISITPSSVPRPGFTYTNRIIYRNLGTATANGTITFIKPSQIVTFTSTQAGIVTNTNGFTYAFTNLLPNETRTFTVTMTVPDAVTINTLLTDSITISAASDDIDVTNNESSNAQIVVNSFDPNDKMESHGRTIPFNEFAQNDYFVYTIRFQNNGTADAINIRIEDLLNAQIDETSILMLSSSHNYNMKRIDNQLVWEFKNIYLLPASANDAASKGYVQFKVKLNPGFQAGDIIPNNAAIYFDNNPAITTATFNSKFTVPLAVSTFDINSLILHPNPANTTIQIGLINSSEQISNVAFYDILGKNVKTISTLATDNLTIDVSDLSKGVYLVEIVSDTNSKVTKKLIIQ